MNCKAEVHTNQIIFRINALNNIISALHSNKDQQGFKPFNKLCSYAGNIQISFFNLYLGYVATDVSNYIFIHDFTYSVNVEAFFFSYIFNSTIYN